jgi:GMP synthase (glutamine-hydrolysing)
MKPNKPVLIIQLRPEDDTSDNEYQAILKYGGLSEEQTERLRIEKNGMPDNLSIHDYSAIIVGGSPFDISTPTEQKSASWRLFWQRSLGFIFRHNYLATL